MYQSSLDNYETLPNCFYKSLLLKPKRMKTGGLQELQLTCGIPCQKNARRRDLRWVQNPVKNTPIQDGIYYLKRCEPFSKVETALYKHSFIIIIIKIN